MTGEGLAPLVYDWQAALLVKGDRGFGQDLGMT
jgi:hypothetical protein